MKTTLEILRGARERIQRGFCQGAMAVNTDDGMVSPNDCSAVAFCGIGALAAELNVQNDYSLIGTAPLDQLCAACIQLFPELTKNAADCGNPSLWTVIRVNDRKFADANELAGKHRILQAFDLAISKLEAQQ